MGALDRLKDLLLQESRERYPNIPDHARSISVPKVSTANGLTQAIVKFIQLSGGHAERVSTTGRMVDSRKVHTDVLGRQITVGSVSYIKGSGMKGSADIHAGINGRFIAIEVKIGKDRQSDDQKQYQMKIENSGGIYLIVRTFDQFVEWWDSFL
jgi:hypothetical protein